LDVTPLCWIITDGKAGMESQCLGVAEALGLDPVLKRVRLRMPWRQLTPYFRFAQTFGFAKDSDPLLPPWPDLVIATGRQSIAAALLVRREGRKAGRKTVLVQIQNPGISPSHFDLVVSPRHDGLEGTNVIATRGALHRVTPGHLAKGAERLAPYAARLKRPFIGVLIGGKNAVYDFPPEIASELGARLKAAAESLGGSLLITPSRRTGEAAEAALKAGLSDTPKFYWEGNGFNPYFGILGLSDFLVVTSDSVNMVSEALATGKPVYVVALPGGSAKFDRFHSLLRDDGLTRRFDGRLETYAYTPLRDMEEVVLRIRALLGAAA